MKHFTPFFIFFLFLFVGNIGKTQSEYYNQNWAFKVYLVNIKPVEIKGNGEISPSDLNGILS